MTWRNKKGEGSLFRIIMGIQYDRFPCIVLYCIYCTYATGDILTIPRIAVTNQLALDLTNSLFS